MDHHDYSQLSSALRTLRFGKRWKSLEPDEVSLDPVYHAFDDPALPYFQISKQHPSALTADLQYLTRSHPIRQTPRL